MSKMAMVVILKSDHDMKILVWRGLRDAENDGPSRFGDIGALRCEWWYAPCVFVVMTGADRCGA